jgi:hypothetical protein
LTNTLVACVRPDRVATGGIGAKLCEAEKRH